MTSPRPRTTVGGPLGVRELEMLAGPLRPSTPHRYAARRDQNEPPLVRLAQSLGALMVQTGPLDWLVGWRGRWVPTEVKTATGTYTDAQVIFLAHAKERQLPTWTWREDSDVLRDLGAVRGA